MDNSPAQAKNYKNKVNSLYFEKGSFVPEGKSESIDYETLYLTVLIQGEEIKIKLEITKSEKSMLKVSDVLEGIKK
jgi:hypothetical protein